MTLIELGLTAWCPTCAGTGFEGRYNNMTGEPVKIICTTCRGEAEVLTEQGQKFAKLVRRVLG